jgi:hypothetical protein
MIYSSIYWFTTSGPRDSLMVAEALNTTNTWAFFLLPLGQFIAAILILNRKMPTVRIFAYAFAMFYNLQLGLVMANLGIVRGVQGRDSGMGLLRRSQPNREECAAGSHQRSLSACLKLSDMRSPNCCPISLGQIRRFA